jgi:PPOX class probable F420-dependent enzyme
MADFQNRFKNQNYLNIETFRKNGESVPTPVWFVQDGPDLYIRTGANSGKVKRIRNNSRIQVAPCKMDGTPVGDWVTASGVEITDPTTDKHVDQLLGKKYGLQKSIFAWAGRLRKEKYTILKVEFLG